jgi:hypothetical protein
LFRIIENPSSLQNTPPAPLERGVRSAYKIFFEKQRLKSSKENLKFLMKTKYFMFAGTKSSLEMRVRSACKK